MKRYRQAVCGYKYCPRCQKVLSAPHFHKNGGTKDNLSPYCIICRRDFVKGIKPSPFRNYSFFICADCHTIKYIDCMKFKDAKRTKPTNTCIPCALLSHSEYCKRLDTNGKTKKQNYTKAHRNRHPERIRQQLKNLRDRGISEISDTYIKKLLDTECKALPRRDMTPELIEAKRQQILTFRAIKQVKQELKNLKD